ncbi:MAG: YqeG family HAD IIIA-type phosphatase [Clostridiaceae bacterium]|nr:YqeG family HAD IIIA-type phosphatase [Clostridiaceae bacterium]
MKNWLTKNFQPDMISEGVDSIDFERLKAEGIKLLLLDIDNTLAVHGSHSADDYAHAAIGNMKDAGLDVFILSNAKRHRARSYADSLGVESEGMAYKPSPKVLLSVCSQKNLDPVSVCMIGDQLLTDIWAARRAGVKSILVNPRSAHEDLHIRFKRMIEKLILKISKSS